MTSKVQDELACQLKERRFEEGNSHHLMNKLSQENINANTLKENRSSFGLEMGDKVSMPQNRAQMTPAFTKHKPSKENMPPASLLDKQKLTTKVINLKREREAENKQKSDSAKLKFTLKRFNSIQLGPLPTIKLCKKPKRRLYYIDSRKPAETAVTLQGLTIKLKISN